MNFVEFYYQFINEGFINHGTVKYRAMGATNKVFRGMLNGIKNIPDRTIDSIEHMIIDGIVNPAVSVTQSFVDLESYNDVVENEVAPAIKQAFNLVR